MESIDALIGEKEEEIKEEKSKKSIFCCNSTQVTNLNLRLTELQNEKETIARAIKSIPVRMKAAQDLIEAFDNIISYHPEFANEHVTTRVKFFESTRSIAKLYRESERDLTRPKKLSEIKASGNDTFIKMNSSKTSKNTIIHVGPAKKYGL